MSPAAWIILTGALGALAVLVAGAAIGSTHRSRQPGRHERPPGPGPDPGPPDIGSMSYDAELGYRARTGQLSRYERWELPLYQRWSEELDGRIDEEDGAALPAVPMAGPAPSVVAVAVASAEEDPADAGWTDNLLATLREAPTSLDSPPGRLPAEHDERLADTGELQLAGLRAEHAAQLRAQDDDAAEYLSRMTTDMAAFRLHGLA